VPFTSLIWRAAHHTTKFPQVHQLFPATVLQTTHGPVIRQDYVSGNIGGLSDEFEMYDVEKSLYSEGQASGLEKCDTVSVPDAGRGTSPTDTE
jgi:hypothetical protein